MAFGEGTGDAASQRFASGCGLIAMAGIPMAAGAMNAGPTTGGRAAVLVGLAIGLVMFMAGVARIVGGVVESADDGSKKSGAGKVLFGFLLLAGVLGFAGYMGYPYLRAEWEARKNAPPPTPAVLPSPAPTAKATPTPRATPKNADAFQKDFEKAILGDLPRPSPSVRPKKTKPNKTRKLSPEEEALRRAREGK